MSAQKWGSACVFCVAVTALRASVDMRLCEDELGLRRDRDVDLTDTYLLLKNADLFGTPLHVFVQLAEHDHTAHK